MKSLIDEVKIQLFNEIKNEKNIECFKTYVVDPAMCHIIDKIYPYLLLYVSMVVLLLILVLYIFIFIMRIKK